MLLLIFSVTAQGLIIIGRPRESIRDNVIDFLIEVCVSLYLYILLILTDWWGNNPYRETEGWILVILVLISLAVNIINLI